MHLLRRDPNRGYLDTWLWIPKQHINVEGTKQALTPTISGDRTVNVVQLWRETAHHIGVPREYFDITTLPFQVVDCRPRSYPQVTIRSRIKLDHRPDPITKILQDTGETVQQEALAALLASRGGILQLACGKGKTVVALELFARLGVPALIVIDNTQLLQQWQEEVADKLDIPDGIGLIQGDIFDWKKPVVLTTYHTLAARAAGLPEEVRRWFGVAIYEEGHHSAAPFFSQGIDAVYGRRYLITATPNRDDGMHIVYNFHVGSVIYKNLKPELIPRIYFVWTGCELQLGDPQVAIQVNDKTGEMHLKKLAGFFGRWPSRLDIVIRHVREMVGEGRHPLVISESVDEVVNLLALWNGAPFLYSDIAIPTTADIEKIDTAEREEARLRLLDIADKLTRVRSTNRRQELEEQQARTEERLKRPMLTASIHPTLLEQKKIVKLIDVLTKSAIPQLRDKTLNPVKRRSLEGKVAEIQLKLLQHEMAKAIEREMWRRQRDYIHELVDVQSDAGMLIEEVEPEIRLASVRNKQVLFSIAKYGKEGLDNPDIDTVLVCEPFSSRNILQQLLGRPSRRRAGKKTPVVVFLEDNIGPLIGMCVQLRSHLKEWPVDEGGPFQYAMIGHPQGQRRRGWKSVEAIRTGSW